MDANLAEICRPGALGAWASRRGAEFLASSPTLRLVLVSAAVGLRAASAAGMSGLLLAAIHRLELRQRGLGAHALQGLEPLSKVVFCPPLGSASLAVLRGQDTDAGLSNQTKPMK
ncbi:MAG: hypothetical protein CO108_30045 [Deltaproteobacteria bacterium CG_4_9_14_3_um_filter_63_12]|nr:MAG: hypothetical protein CO108_30045 [Deltaproteobacteria bacterium CG_4_9_14_3_um_filter_63_12]